jgi:hypothetical protein
MIQPTSRSWSVSHGGTLHEVRLRHHWWSGMAEVRIDGELVARRRGLPMDASPGFVLRWQWGGRSAVLQVQPVLSWMRAMYRGAFDLWVDGVRQTAWCERCGYDLRASGQSADCPECGTPVAVRRGWPRTTPPQLERAPGAEAGAGASVESPRGGLVLLWGCVGLVAVYAAGVGWITGYTWAFAVIMGATLALVVAPQIIRERWRWSTLPPKGPGDQQ